MAAHGGSGITEEVSDDYFQDFTNRIRRRSGMFKPYSVDKGGFTPITRVFSVPPGPGGVPPNTQAHSHELQEHPANERREHTNHTDSKKIQPSIYPAVPG